MRQVAALMRHVATLNETSSCFNETSSHFNGTSSCFNETSSHFNETSSCFDETSSCFNEVNEIPCHSTEVNKWYVKDYVKGWNKRYSFLTPENGFVILAPLTGLFHLFIDDYCSSFVYK
uniref:Uncharacterized protein n=1 Tax=Micrurus spixii TaxID=129469 RepID=A0A2D4M5D2_9SAUR